MSKLIVTLFILIFSTNVFAQNTSDKPFDLGVYYFDGWTSTTTNNYVYLTPALLKDSVREPIWGWITSTQSIVDSQIVVAAKSGINFFAFDWYYYKDYTSNIPLNHALSLYLNSPHKDILKFCLMVANDNSTFDISPYDWKAVSKLWLNLFEDSSYEKADGKPLLIFFSPADLVTAFGSNEAVSEAFDSLRAAAVREGLNGVTIAACALPQSMGLVSSCGFDVITGYNYAGSGFTAGDTANPIENLLTGEVKIWNQFKNSTLPIIPVGTLNWDPRPWSIYEPPGFQYYVGYSGNSVYNTVSSLYEWINSNPYITTNEHIGILYAWNEYGEGGWLTPSIPLGDSLLQGLTKAVSEIPAGIKQKNDNSTTPDEFTLSQNYPNPFNPTTEIVYSLPSRANVSLRVYNVLGQGVATLYSGMQTAGRHIAKFNGDGLTSGIYFYRLDAGNFFAVKKMLLLK